MSDTLSFTELDAQHVELLPARTVLSMMFTAHGTGGSNYGNGNGGGGGTAIAVNAANLNNVGNVNLFGHQTVAGDQVNVAQANAHGGNGHFTSFYNVHNNIHNGNGGHGGTAVAVNAGNLNNVGNVNLGGNQTVTGDQINIAQANANGGRG